MYYDLLFSFWTVFPLNYIRGQPDYCSPAARLIDLSVPVAISSVLCRLTEKRFPVMGLYHMQWFAPSRYTLHPAFRSSFSNSLYRTASPPILIKIITRIRTYVKKKCTCEYVHFCMWEWW